MYEILITMGLVMLGIVLLIGIIRIIFEPTNNIIDFLMQLMLLDWLGDALTWVFENISNLWEND